MTQIVKIGDISTQIRGVSYSKSDAILNKQDGYLPVLRANNIQEQGLVLEDFVYVPEGKISEKQRILAGDVIIAASSGSISLVGKAASAKEDINAGFGAFCKILRPNTELVDPRYFANYFQTKKYRQIISNLAAGANINNLKNEHLDDLEILLPPLEEQRRIASILDKANELRQKRQQAIEKLDQLLQATFIDMFGDPISNPKGFPIKDLEFVASQVTDGTHHTPKREISGIPLLSARNVLMGKIDFLNIDFVGEEEYERLRKRCEPKRGDILISCSGSIGRVSSVDTDRPFVMVRSAALVKLKKDIVTSKFMEYLLRTPYLQSQMIRSSKSSSQANLFQEPIKRLKIFLPPIELQENFEKFIAISTKEKEKLVQSNDKLEALFKSLQNQAFSGNL